MSSEQGPGPAGPMSPDERLFSGRGHTIISPSVIEKIASVAAAEADGVEGVARSGITRMMPFGQDSPKADADVRGEHATVDMSIRVRYPQPVGKTCEAVRQRVASRLRELTGLAVNQINISVPELVLGQERPERRRVE